MMMLFSTVPTFAAVSPQPSTFKYKVVIIPTEGGDGSYKFTTGIDERGRSNMYLLSHFHMTAILLTTEISGGPAEPTANYTDANMNIIISR